MNTVFQLAKGARLSAGLSAQIVGDELERIRGQNSGNLSAGDVVRAATKKRNPLHRQFEWNDSIAGNKYREAQARILICSVTVSITGEDDSDTIRAFVQVGTETSPNYTSITAAMADPETRMKLLQRALNEAKAWKKKYDGFSELARIMEAIDDVAG